MGFAHGSIGVLAAFVLAAASLAVGPVVPERQADASAVEMPTLSAFGSPTFDGRLDTLEWSAAARMELFARLPEASGGGNVPAVLLVMNDDRNLWIAVRIGTVADQASFSLTLDTDADGAPTSGSDFVSAQLTENGFTSVDGFWSPCSSGPGQCLQDDAAASPAGTRDLLASGSRPDETRVFELVHPLDSADDARDVSLRPGDTIGFQAVIGLGETRAVGCDTGACGGGVNGYGRITVARPTATAIGPGPSVVATLFPSAAHGAWDRGTTVVKVAGVGAQGSSVALRVWAAPAPGPPLGGQRLRLTGNSTHRIFANGTTILHAYAVDGQGHPGPWQAVSVHIDGIAPTVTPPRLTFRDGGIVGGAPSSTQVAWLGADAASGVATFELQESVLGGPYVTVANVRGDAVTAVGRAVRIGPDYRYRIRATDVAGNRGRWVEGPSYRVFLVDSRNSAITYNGSWAVAPNHEAVGGSTTFARTAGATASLSVLGSAVALVAPTGADHGQAIVTLDHGRMAGPKIVDLGSPAASARVAYRTEWSETGQHVIEVRVLGTPGHPRIDIDAFLVIAAVGVTGIASVGTGQPVTFEAEVLGMDGDVSSIPIVRIMSPYGHGLWSNDRQLEWAAQPGETISLAVPITIGRWNLIVYPTLGPNYGEVQVSYGWPVGRRIDLYAPTVRPGEPVNLGTIVSSWSQVQGISFTVTAHNAASDGYSVGIDKIVLVPTE